MKLGTSGLLTVAVLLLMVALLLYAPACAPMSEGTGLPSSQEPVTGIKKGNPKLDPRLGELIEAEKRGEADSFARTRNIEMVDGAVWVIVEAAPGQADAAAKAATYVDARQVLTSGDLVKALVPITSISELAEEKSIRHVRLPIRPWAEGSK